MYLEAVAPTHRMDLPYLERLCTIQFVKASGPGGQHRNKRETGVRLHHPPSGITVMATERRSQARNRAVAFERMVAQLAILNEELIPKPPRKLTPKPRRLNEQRLDLKHQRAQTKTQRQWRPSDA